jgi:3-hydroxyacyl-CoA dehydrogenase
MVTAGCKGVKSGMGFYDYSKGLKDKAVEAGFKKR